LKLKNKGESYIEYLIIFGLVIGFTVMALNYVGESVKESILSDYFEGKKVKLSLKGIYTEKIGRYGGTKSAPIAIKKANGNITLDLGYIILEDLPTQAPKLTDPGNKYGANTIRYYAKLLENTYDSVKKNPVHAEQAPYLKAMAEIAYSLAISIDEIAYYDDSNLNYAVMNEVASFAPLKIEKFDDSSYLIREFELYPENILVNLELKKADFDLFTSIGMLYATAFRFDNGAPVSIWLIRADINGDGKTKIYTLLRSSHGYTSLDKAIDLNFDLLRFNQSEENIDEADIRFYNLLKMFELYAQLYDRLSTDEATKFLVKTIAADVKNIVYGVEKRSIQSANKLLIKFSPTTSIDLDIIEKFTSSINNLKFKNEGE
jgi:hypothetical protein